MTYSPPPIVSARMTPPAAPPAASSGPPAPLEFVLNGESAVYAGRGDARLLDVLRDVFRLTSVKCGCREGECGACAVIFNDRLVNSCLVPAGMVALGSVTTLEGFRETERFAVLDRAYARFSAVQCGFCIPGMVLASEALLRRNPRPSPAEIREGLSGNLCRCTGYNAIVEAVTLASKEGEGLW
jgi:carbon-monoxide dehydrogenase small subunit